MRTLLKNWLPYGLVQLLSKRRTASVLPVPLTLERRNLEEIFPGIEQASVVLPRSELLRHDFMASPVKELAILGLLCSHLRPMRLFEIGTYVGSATLVMAMNSAPGAEIHTLDVDPPNRPKGFPEFVVGEAFRQTKADSRITQHFGDSRTFDFTSFRRRMDLVFIDANHTREFVEYDSRNALDMIRPGGVIVWDDYVYTAEHPECSGVAEYLRELSATHSCYQIEGARFAVSRRADD